MSSLITIAGVDVRILNLHLDYRSVRARENQIVNLVDWFGAHGGDLAVMAGDFNCDPQSSVYRYLVGHQSLGSTETCWRDLYLSHVRRSQTESIPTLDFHSNPRWRNAGSLEVPMRCDWILSKCTSPEGRINLKVDDARVFGREKEIPSDHYGVSVYVHIEKSREESGS